MKQKLLFVLSLVMMVLCSQSLWAEREKPVLPPITGETPDAGESYYLYNVEAHQFLCAGNNWGTQASLGDYPNGISLIVSEGDCYQLTFIETGKMLFSDSQTTVFTDRNSQDIKKTHWSVTSLPNGSYKLQSHVSSPNYTENYYLGWDRGQNTVVGQMEDGAFEWIFVKPSNSWVKHYIAELSLYNALQQAEAYGVQSSELDSYEQMYTNRGAHTEVELNTSATELNLKFVDRAPLAPSGVQPVGGINYYVYNVAVGLYIGSDSYSSYPAMSETATVFYYQHFGDNTFQLRKGSVDGYYLFDGSSQTDYLTYNSTGSAWRDVWERVTTEGGYKFRRYNQNKNYDENQFIGYAENNNARINSNLNDETCVWRFVSISDVKHYEAELKLYHTLQNVDPIKGIIPNYDYYARIYANRCNLSTNDLNGAASALNNCAGLTRGYVAPYWNECPIFWSTPDGTFGQNNYDTWSFDYPYTSGTYFRRDLNSNQSSSISATVNVDEPATLIYSLRGSTQDTNMKVYVDDVLVRSLDNEQMNTRISAQGKSEDTRFFEELTPGIHTITWKFTSYSSSGTKYVNLSNIGIMKSPLITVSLLEPGSLGTEVLYNTDHIKNVRRLKVKGKMNSDDWSKIKMMSYLQDLDLSEAEFTEIPENQFSCSADTSSWFLHKIVLPEGVTKIGKRAFEYSLLDGIQLPSTLTTMGAYAFRHSHVQEMVIPDDLIYFPNEKDGYDYSSYYSRAFAEMFWLERFVCPKNLTYIPPYMFSYNYHCKEVVLPEKLETIDKYAFFENHDMKTTFPESLRSIGNYAFEDCWGFEKLQIPFVTGIGNYAFRWCRNLTDVEIGVNIYNLSDNVFSGCNSLQTLRLDCPTVVSYNTSSSYYPVDASHIKDVNLEVPQHIMTSYKLDEYWYNFKSIAGFSTAEIQDWTINRPLTLNHDRFEGNPNITITGSHDRFPSLKINGDYAQQINNLICGGSRYDYENYPGQILSQCNNVTINGSAAVDLENTAKYWYFFSLPFDMKISDIYHGSENIQKAIRYYDGANRAAVGATGSWKNYDADAVIPAGTGFIMQTNEYTWSRFYAVDNESKQNMVSYKEFVKTLDVNDSPNASNKGWNLVGNPWQCFYNTHMLNFTGPITVWSTKNRTYSAYSIIDDDYALRPNEAFFVQCPNEEYNTIGFPTQGRQLTSVIESQNAARSEIGSASNRQVVNITISNGEMEDQTRVVLNEEASMGYETACDASKFMSMDNSVPQLYTMDEQGTSYAINERPTADGTVRVGFYAGVAGEYTISVKRCDAEQVFLTDYLTGQTKEITNDSYHFSAEVGTNNGRFCLTFVSNEETAIENIEQLSNAHVEVFSLDGKYLGSDASKLKTGVYVIRQGKKINKVMVR